MKKHLLTFILLSIFTGFLYGQDHCLKPEKFKSFQESLDYFYGDSTSTFYKKLGDNPIVRYVPGISIIQGKNMISIEKDSLSNITLILHHWKYNPLLFFSRHGLRMVEYSVPISSELADLTKNLVSTAIRGSCGPTKTVMDGNVFYFYAEMKEGDQITGSTFNPSEGSDMEELVNIFYEFALLAEGKKQANQEEITKRIITLTEKLNK
jgi:hypothetical protein